MQVDGVNIENLGIKIKSIFNKTIFFYHASIIYLFILLETEDNVALLLN